MAMPARPTPSLPVRTASATCGVLRRSSTHASEFRVVFSDLSPEELAWLRELHGSCAREAKP
ncbi:MAG: hypothetical protein U5L04_10125 [Trueperaceae bacterium]|nr:hypothetical protein [Trueperaceae bacterium]